MVLLGLQANGLSELLSGKRLQGNSHKNETEIDGWSMSQNGKEAPRKGAVKAERKHTFFVDIQATHMNSK